jgi:hypothetical protein
VTAINDEGRDDVAGAKKIKVRRTQIKRPPDMRVLAKALIELAKAEQANAEAERKAS